MKLFVTPVWSVKSTYFPEAEINIPATFSSIYRSMYVSLKAGIKNSRSF